MKNIKVNYFKVHPEKSLKYTLDLMKQLEQISLNDEVFLQWVKFQFGDGSIFTLPKRLWLYIKNNFTFKHDSYDEVLISPSQLRYIKVGDCDDFALFVHTVLTAFGVPCKYILFSEIKNKPTHIAAFGLGSIIDGANENFNIYPKKYNYLKLV